MNRFLLKGFASVLTMAVMFGTVSCSDDDDKPCLLYTSDKNILSKVSVCKYLLGLFFLFERYLAG